jgi:hypothetical protein
MSVPPSSLIALATIKSTHHHHRRRRRHFASFVSSVRLRVAILPRANWQKEGKEKHEVSIIIYLSATIVSFLLTIPRFTQVSRALLVMQVIRSTNVCMSPCRTSPSRVGEAIAAYHAVREKSKLENTFSNTSTG